MKIFCITGNRSSEETPLSWYVLTDSSILRSDNPFFVPDFDTEFIACPSLAVRIDRLGKSIAPRFASRYYNEATVGVVVVARRLLGELRREGMPWDRAVAFDRSCFIGEFRAASTILDGGDIELTCGDSRILINAGQLRLGVDETVAEVSRTNTLKTGDLILCSLPFPAPKDVTSDECLPMAPGSNLHARRDGDLLLEIRFK